MPWSGILEEGKDVTESIPTPIRSFYRLQRVEMAVYGRLFHQVGIEITSGNNAPGPDVLKINQNRTSYTGVLRHARYTCSVHLFYLKYIQRTFYNNGTECQGHRISPTREWDRDDADATPQVG
jgi:hypothetical protein